MADAKFDLEALRLRQDFSALASTRKLLTVVPVRKPDKMEFVRVHPDPAYQLEVALLEFRAEQKTYLVVPALHQSVEAESTAKALMLAVNRQGEPFLWPVPLPALDGRSNRWNESARDAALRAQREWVRVVSNMRLGAYELNVPTGSLPDPEFPDLSFAEIVQIAFRDHIIENRDHPVLRGLRGET